MCLSLFNREQEIISRNRIRSSSSILVESAGFLTLSKKSVNNFESDSFFLFVIHDIFGNFLRESSRNVLDRSQLLQKLLQNVNKLYVPTHIRVLVPQDCHDNGTTRR